MALQKLSGVLSFALVLSLSSCGGSGGGSSSSSPKKNNNPVKNPQPISVEQEVMAPFYRAELKPLNPNFTGETSGVVTVSLQDDEMVVEQTMANAPGGVRHFQAIMSGSSCAAIDENGDGYIDLAEGSQKFGNRLIPLDSILDSQLEGSNFGPIANELNAYFYKRSASLSKILSDLTALDPDENDDLVKINSDKELALQKRVVVVLGTSESVPDSVSGNSNFSAAEGLPIACGELKAINNL